MKCRTGQFKVGFIPTIFRFASGHHKTKIPIEIVYEVCTSNKLCSEFKSRSRFHSKHRERERKRERERGREGERGTSTAAETIMLDEIKSFSVLEDRETGVLSRSIWCDEEGKSLMHCGWEFVIGIIYLPQV